MNLILIGVMVAATVLYGRNMGWKWVAGCWGAWVLAVILAQLGVPGVPVIMAIGAALTLAVKGVEASRS